MATDGARKDDSGKAPVYAGFLAYFPRAARAVALVSAAGYEKYGEWAGWRRVPDGRRRYTDAMARHMLNEATGKVYDMVDDMGQPGTRCLEAAMVAWNALARLDKMLEDEPDLLLRMPFETGAAALEANMRKIEARLPFSCPDLDQDKSFDVVSEPRGDWRPRIS